MIGYQQIQSKIIDVLKSNLSSIRKFYYEVPARGFAYPPHPLIAVEEIGGPIHQTTVSDQDTHVIRFYITIVDKGKDPESVKKKVQEYSEQVIQVLNQKRTLDGLVQWLRFSNREIDEIRERDYTLCGVRLTLEVDKIV